MKTCEEIREVLLSDYLDGELAPAIQAHIDSHLAVCRECREFLAEVSKSAVEPFAAEQQLKVPEHLWIRIKETIENEQQVVSPASAPAWLWKISFPKKAWLVPAFAALLVFSGGIWALRDHQLQAQALRDKEQVEYLALLLTPASWLSGTTGEEPTTPIEKYFL